MILKYKTINDAWIYKTLKDFFVGELDISEIVYKHTNNGAKKLDLSNGIYENEALVEILKRIDDAFDHKYSFNLCTYELRCTTKYLIVGYKDNNSDRPDYNCIIVNNESYLMSDEGKTIEKLM